MEITKQEAIATLDDRDSAIEVLSEIYARITELKNERDRYKVKALARKVELDKIKSKPLHTLDVDNYTISYRDYRGIDSVLSKPFIEGVGYRIIIKKDKI